MLRFARRADELGYDFVWVVDHLQAAPLEAGILEAWTVLSAVGASTSRVGLALQVVCQSFRHPALLAKMAVTLDLVSGQRQYSSTGHAEELSYSVTGEVQASANTSVAGFRRRSSSNNNQQGAAGHQVERRVPGVTVALSPSSKEQGP